MITSPASILYDAEGNPVAVQRDGTRYVLSVGDAESRDLLLSIRAELRAIREILGEAFDVRIKPQESR